MNETIITGRPPQKNIEVTIAGGGASDGAIVDGTTSTIKATVFDYTSSNPLAVVLRDTAGDYVSVGGGTQYTEDAAAAANPTGTAVNLIRQDTPASLVTTDGDNVTQRGTTYGAGFVQVLTSAGAFVDTFGGGTQYTEDAAAAADPVGTMGMAVRADALAAVTSTDGDNIAYRATNKGELYVKQTDAVPVTDNSGSLTVDNPILSIVGGGTEAAAMRVTIASDSTGVLSVDDNGGSLTVDGTITEANSAAIAASLSVMDDWDETNRAAVNTIAGQVGVQGASGVVTALTQRVVLATDVGLPAGTSNIGDVDVLTLPNVTVGTMANLTESLVDDAAFTPATSRVLPVGYTFDDVTPDSVNEGDIGAARMSANRNIYNTIRDAAGNERGANVSAGNALLVDGSATTQPVSGTVAVTNAALGVVGGGVEATALRVTIASDSTGLLSIDDNGGSITVDGTITEANSAAMAASLSVLDDWDETDRAKVNLIVGQAGIAAGTGVDGVTVPRVTLATNVALPAGTNAIGKLAANSGVDIGDVDITSISTGTNAIGRVGHDITGIGHGVKTITSAGTDEALAGSTACKRVVIQAQTDNTSGVAVGATGVDATIATGNGIYLNPGDAFEIEIDNLADIFVDALVSGEGVRYSYFT